MPAGCNCGPNSSLARALGCHCLRRGTTVIASRCHFRGCKEPLFRIVSGAISGELPLPFLPFRSVLQPGDNADSKIKVRHRKKYRASTFVSQKLLARAARGRGWTCKNVSCHQFDHHAIMLWVIPCGLNRRSQLRCGPASWTRGRL